MRIYHNVPALYAYNSLNATSRSLTKSIQRLSTGLRINSAADDAAGLAISEKMRSQISGLEIAARNAQDGISMLQTAEGALESTQSILQRMRELAVQAANDTLTAQDREYIQQEIDQLKFQVNNIAHSTQFNGKRLLDGSSAGLWSSTNLATKAFIRGSLREIDQFNQKTAFEGNYRIKITAEPGVAQVQKTDIMKIKHPNVLSGVLLDSENGAKDVRVDNLPAGTYTLKTEANATDTGVKLTGAYGVANMDGISGNEYVHKIKLDEITVDVATALYGGKKLNISVDGGASNKVTITDFATKADAYLTALGKAWAGASDDEKIAAVKSSLKEQIDDVTSDATWPKTDTLTYDEATNTITYTSTASDAAAADRLVLSGDSTESKYGGSAVAVSESVLSPYDGKSFNGATVTLSTDDGEVLATAMLTPGTAYTTATNSNTVLTDIANALKLVNPNVDITVTTGGTDGLDGSSTTPHPLKADGLEIKTISGAANLKLTITKNGETNPFVTINRAQTTTAADKALFTTSKSGTSVPSMVASSSNAKNNASVLLEVTGVDTANKTVSFKATANILGADGTVSNVVDNNIVITEGTTNAQDILVNSLGKDALHLDLQNASAFSVGAKLVYNVTMAAGNAHADNNVNVVISGTQNKNWPDNWVAGTKDGITDNPVKFGLDATKVAESEIHFRNFYLNENNGTVYEGDIVLVTNDKNHPLKDMSSTPAQSLAVFESTYIGEIAKTDTKLRDLDKFWTSEGTFLLTDPQTISITQGNGESATITLYATDTLAELQAKLNNAISNGLGQAKYAKDNAHRFVTYVDEKTAGDHSYGLETVGGTFIIRSLVAGAAGELNFSGDEDLINAMSLNVVRESKENSFVASIYDAHDGSTVVSNVRVSGNQLIGVIHENVDVEFDAMAGIQASWNENQNNFVLTKTDQPYETVLHLVDNSTVFQIGANEGEDLALDIGNMSTDSLGVSRVVVTNRQSAARSITILDQALTKVSSQRSKIGAYQNAMEYTISNLTTTYTNLTESESRIRDADMAQEMMNFIKLQILNQSGTSMLAQANQLPQSVLSLIGG